VVIINRGRVVAVDTPDNLTSRLRGSETMYLQVDAAGAEVASVLQRVSGVTRVAIADTKQQIVGYEVDSETGRDVRRELAAAIVGRGWGLLEMRPMRLSLEEIFLHVTTEETPATTAASTEAETASSEELVP
jgi:ABC-2 type transport system ATP-binding protein